MALGFAFGEVLAASGARLARSRPAREKKIADVALKFLAAASRRDAPAAKALIAGAEQCASIGSSTCQKKTDEWSAALPKVLEKVPAPFVAGSIVQRDGASSERVVWVNVFLKDQCADRMAVPVMEHRESLRHGMGAA